MVDEQKVPVPSTLTQGDLPVTHKNLLYYCTCNSTKGFEGSGQICSSCKIQTQLKLCYVLIWPTGSVLLRQSDCEGRTPLDLVLDSAQRERLLCSAQLGDAALRGRASCEVSNLPLLEVGSTLLAHILISYQQERGLSGLVRPSGPGHRLLAALGEEPLETVTRGWTDQRALRLAQDTETLLELGRGKHEDLVSRAVRESQGENTHFLMEIMENLRCRVEELLSCNGADEMTY